MIRLTLFRANADATRVALRRSGCSTLAPDSQSGSDPATEKSYTPPTAVRAAKRLPHHTFPAALAIDALCSPVRKVNQDVSVAVRVRPAVAGQIQPPAVPDFWTIRELGVFSFLFTIYNVFMNKQMAFLRNVIDTARTGDQAALRLLRSVCRIAADKSPDDDLIVIAQCLFDIRREAAIRSVEQN